MAFSCAWRLESLRRWRTEQAQNQLGCESQIKCKRVREISREIATIRSSMRARARIEKDGTETHFRNSNGCREARDCTAEKHGKRVSPDADKNKTDSVGAILSGCPQQAQRGGMGSGVGRGQGCRQCRGCLPCGFGCGCSGLESHTD
jgi:hypothetical protein